MVTPIALIPEKRQRDQEESYQWNNPTASANSGHKRTPEGFHKSGEANTSQR